MQTIAKLTEDLQAFTAAISKEQTTISDAERNGLFMAYEGLRAELETPVDAAARLLFGGFDLVALEIAMDMRLLTQLTIAQGQSKSTVELSAATGADPDLTNRVLRLLAASNIVKETGEGQYAASRLTPAFSDMSPLSKSMSHIAHCSVALTKLPGYLKKTKWQTPNDGWDGPFQHAMDTKAHYFEWMAQIPEEQEAFNVHMQLQRMERGPDWFDSYPVQDRIIAHDKDVARKFLVDVGGGVGHDLAAFSAKFPQLTPRLVLQDQEHVLADTDNQPFKLSADIERTPVDFFKDQPIKGAKVYYMRTVLHDWPDKQAKQILKHIYDAMDTESVLLVNENALPDQGVIGFQARADFMIMSFLSGIDRNLKQYTKLLEDAGFEVKGVYRPPVPVPGAGTLFEATKRA